MLETTSKVAHLTVARSTTVTVRADPGFEEGGDSLVNQTFTPLFSSDGRRE